MSVLTWLALKAGLATTVAIFLLTLFPSQNNHRHAGRRAESAGHYEARFVSRNGARPPAVGLRVGYAMP